MSENRSRARSEAVRQRRQEQIRKQERQTKFQRRSRAQKKKSRSKSGYRELPPITARGVVNDFAIERRKKAGKRRFNAVLNLPHSRLNSLPLPGIRIRAGWRWLSFFLVLVLGTCLYLAWTMPEFRVSAAHIVGNQRIPADEINSALELNSQPVFLLKPSRIEAATLRAYPELASVKVTIALPNIVTINVTERQPIIQWQQDSGYTWVDEDGVAFRPRGEVPGLITVQAMGTPPVLSTSADNSSAPTPFITSETVKALQTLAPYVPAGTPIVYDPATGLSWNDGRGWKAVFGFGGEDIAMKVQVYQAMVDWVTQHGVRPVLINVTYPDAPFYRVDQAQTNSVTSEQ